MLRALRALRIPCASALSRVRARTQTFLRKDKMDEQQQTRRHCIACNAIAFADSCGDADLRDAILAFAPPHTCTESATTTANPTTTTANPTTTTAIAPQTQEDFATLKTLDVIAFNLSAERKFVLLASRLVPCTTQYLIRETAYALDISTETAKRYLVKHSATHAEFEIKQNVVFARTREA